MNARGISMTNTSSSVPASPKEIRNAHFPDVTSEIHLKLNGSEMVYENGLWNLGSYFLIQVFVEGVSLERKSIQIRERNQQLKEENLMLKFKLELAIYKVNWVTFVSWLPTTLMRFNQQRIWRIMEISNHLVLNLSLFPFLKFEGGNLVRVKTLIEKGLNIGKDNEHLLKVVLKPRIYSFTTDILDKIFKDHCLNHSDLAHFKDILPERVTRIASHGTLEDAIVAGNLDAIMGLISKDHFTLAVAHGNLEIMKWLKESCCPWDALTLKGSNKARFP